MTGAMRFMIGFSALLLPAVIHAGTGGNPLDLKLISETRSIRAGSSFCLGLHLRHPPGSHTYWKHPGIVGLATSVDWELPPGFVAGEIQWPAPEVVTMAGYQTQGYEGETLLLIPLTAPADLTTKSVALTARVSWMCCGKTCHPAAKIPFTVTLPVAASAEPDPVTRPLFAKFRARLPRRDPAWKTEVRRDHHTIILTLQAPANHQPPATAAGIRFFTADGQVDSNRQQQPEILADGRLRLQLVLSATAPPHPATLPGVVAFPAGWQNGGQPFHLEINPGY
jgi:thiol:disulfide interchange protein DsbD